MKQVPPGGLGKFLKNWIRIIADAAVRFIGRRTVGSVKASGYGMCHNSRRLLISLAGHQLIQRFLMNEWTPRIFTTRKKASIHSNLVTERKKNTLKRNVKFPLEFLFAAVKLSVLGHKMQFFRWNVVCSFKFETPFEYFQVKEVRQMTFNSVQILEYHFKFKCN